MKTSGNQGNFLRAAAPQLSDHQRRVCWITGGVPGPKLKRGGGGGGGASLTRSAFKLGNSNYE